MKHLLNIVLILILTCFSAWAQEKKLAPSRSQSELDMYIDSASYYLEISPAKSFDYIEKMLSLSIKTGNKVGEAKSYQSLGKANYNLNQFDLAIDYYTKSCSVYEAINTPKDLNLTREMLGDALIKTGNYTEGLNYYRQALKYFESGRMTDEAIRTMKKIADIYILTNQPDNALELLNKVLETEKIRNNSTGIVDAQNSIAQVYQQINKGKEAIKYYSNSADIARNTSDNEALKSSLRGKSSALRQEKKYDEELEVRQELLDISVKNNEDGDLAEENLQIGNIYLEKKETGKAIPYIQKSVEISDESKNLSGKAKALQVLSTAYSQQHDYNKALELYQEYVTAMDELYKKREADILASVQINTTLNRKLERLDLIEKDLDVSRKTVDLLHQEQLVNLKEMKIQRMLTYSLSVALLILLIASVFILRSSNLKRKANQLLALRSLRSQMNPHFIYNSLNSVNSYISKNDEKTANKYLSDFSRLMRSVMENSKHDFVSLSTEIETLKLYLNLEHSRFNDKFDYSFTVDEKLETDAITLPPMLIQPFIENAIWHGLRYLDEKGLLKVEIAKEAGLLRIIIEDNGIGRKKSEELKTRFQKGHASTGVMNIENRIQIINHLFNARIGIRIEDLDKQNMQGTRIVLTMPLNNNPENKS